VIDLERARSLRLAVDPLGGANLDYWTRSRRVRLDITVVNRTVDPTFAFMTLDYDGRSGWTARRHTRWRSSSG